MTFAWLRKEEEIHAILSLSPSAMMLRAEDPAVHRSACRMRNGGSLSLV